MNMHKNTRLTPHHRQAIWLAYTQGKESVTSLARRYQVSRVTIYRALKAARGRLLKPQTSTNNRFKQAKYGMKRLAKVERGIQEKLDLLRKYPEDLQFPNEIRKPHPKKRQGIQTAHRCNARPFSRNAANHHRSRKPEGQVRQAAYAQLGRPTAAYPKLSAPLPYPTRIGRHLRPFRK